MTTKKTPAKKTAGPKKTAPKKPAVVVLRLKKDLVLAGIAYMAGDEAPELTEHQRIRLQTRGVI